MTEMKNQNEKVVPLSLLKASDFLKAGNKAAVLGELLNYNINVPDGFCITINAFKEIVGPILASPFNKTDHIPFPGWPKLSEKIMRSSFPHELAGEIQQGLKYIKIIRNAPSLFCVRSSSTIEDSPNYSFAGQFHTSIGLFKLKEIIYAVKRCWASLFGEKVLSYINNLDVGMSEIAMAVIVQGLVPAEKSGVMFTGDPLTGENIFLIDAAWGLGFPLVNGQITPDHIRLSPSGKILSCKIGSKKHAFIVSNQSLEEKVVTPSKRNTLCLNEKEINILLKTAHKITHIFDSPQDIEFSFFENELWILQTRPITGINRNPAPLEEVEERFE